MTDFRECMPILWLEKLRASLNIQGNAQGDGLSILPPALRTSDWTHDSSAGCGDRVSKGLLNEQEGKFRRDWSKVKKTFPKADRETYLYYWLIVNTRSFYFELAGLKAPKLKEDHMALCPFVDFFNHADRGVSGLGNFASIGVLSSSVMLLSTRTDIQSLQIERMVRLRRSRICIV